MAAKKNKPALVDLRKELLLQVDGAAEKDHTLKWDVLRAIGDATQELIYKLAKYSLEENTLPPEALKLDFIGFHKGSAIPDFRLMDKPNLLFPVEKSYEKLNNDFSFVLGSVGEGNYQAIADRYHEPSVVNDVVDAVYNFTNSAGTKPLNVVRKIKTTAGIEVYKPIVKIKRMSLKVRGLLHMNDPLIIKSADVSKDEDAVGKFKIKTGKNGRKYQKDLHLYSQKEATLSLRFDSIETDKRLYTFTHEVLFNITEDSKNHVAIENQLLDIFAFGQTMEEAKEDIFEQFDYTYRRLNQFKNDQLSDHLQNAKTYINLIVGTVKDK